MLLLLIQKENVKLVNYVKDREATDWLYGQWLYYQSL